MRRQQEYERHQAYIEAEGLDQLIDWNLDFKYRRGTFDSVGGELGIPFPPEPEDLVRLHKLVRARKAFTVLEFGLGYSTVVMADALAKNERDWESLPSRPEIRNRHMFQIFSVDASDEWIESARSRLPASLASRVHLRFSEVEIGTHNGQLCHFYTNLPDIVPDFILIDGPHPKDVKGSIRGLSFQCDERTVMSGDLLFMEPTLLPGTFILIDGRTNNARFLERNLTRDFSVFWDREGDVTMFELTEERLGRYNVIGSDFF